MATEVETELFLRAIEDAGAIPSKSLLEMEYANMQAYLSPDRSTRVYIRIDVALMTKSDCMHNLKKLGLLELAPALFS